MGRMALIVDASGYKRWEESGMTALWSGGELFRPRESELAAILNNTDSENFWNPPASEWCLPRPYQFDPNFYKDTEVFPIARFTKDNFTPGAGITITHWNPHKTPLEDYPNDVWLNFGAIPDPIVPPMLVSMDNLAAAAGVEFPAGANVIACTTVEIENWLTPFLQSIAYDPPEDFICFGFGNLALISFERKLTLCRTEGSHIEWERIGSRAEEGNSLLAGMDSGLYFGFPTRFPYRPIMCIPVGRNDLYCMSSPESWPLTFPFLRGFWPKSPDDPGGYRRGKWWIAAYPGQRVLCQVQNMVYRFAQHIDLAAGTFDDKRKFFDLGQEYTPTSDTDGDVEPQLWADVLLPQTSGENPAEGTPVAGGLEFRDEVTGIFAKFVVTDEQNQAFFSDGTHFKGGIHIRLESANNDDFPAYKYGVCPQFRELMLRFPPKIVPRDANPVLLDDTEFMPDWNASASLHDADGKMISVKINSRGAARLVSEGLDTRQDLPIHLVDDVNNDSTYSEVRAAGWIVDGIDLEELLAIRGGDPLDPANHMHLQAKGLLVRAEQPFAYRAAVAAPLNKGDLVHTEAVSQVLRQSGFDVDDGAQVQIEEDTGSDFAKTLGNKEPKPSEAGKKESHGWLPDWDDNMLAWAYRVARQHANWLLYEDLTGLVFYKHDPINDILDGGETLPIEAIIYATGAQALAAGVSRHQVYEVSAERTIEPVKYNVIRVIPNSPTLPQVVVQDVRSWTDPSYENYVGIKKTYVWAPKWVLTARQCRFAAARAMLRLRRRKPSWKIKVRRLAPWQILPNGIFVGSIITLRDRGDYQVVKLGVKQLNRFNFETTATLEKLPQKPNIAV